MHPKNKPGEEIDFHALLNTSVPFAPLSEAEVAERLTTTLPPDQPTVEFVAPDPIGWMLGPGGSSPREPDPKGREWTAARAAELMARAESLGARVEGLSIRYSDPAGLVTVTVNGAGDLLGLTFGQDAERDLRALGTVSTEALVEARRKARRACDDLQTQEYSDLPDARRITELFRKIPETSTGLDPRDAGVVDLLVALRALDADHGSRFVEKDIGRGLGHVSVRLKDFRTLFAFDHSASRMVRLERLSEAAVEAAREAHDEAALTRSLEFAKTRHIHEQRMF